VDPSRTVQALANLVANAVKFSPEGSEIDLEATIDGPDAVFTVTDRGLGFDPGRAERLFEMFVQAPGHEDTGGRGLGLYLVRALCELHGGAVSARSDGVGRGSTFTMRLPVGTAWAAVDRRSPVEAPTRRRVLIADDNEDAAATLQLLIESGGHEVRTAANGADAVRLALEFEPEIALLDLGMPVMDGYEVARRLADAVPRPRLVALSGWGDAQARQRTAAAGFDLHLVKPASAEALARVLAEGRGGH